MTPAELKAHPLFPFGDFRTNEASFLLLELFWPAVVAEELPPDVQAHVVPVSDADRDQEGFGCPVMMSFWAPEVGRGLRVLYNDPEGSLEKVKAGMDEREGDEGTQIDEPEPETPRPVSPIFISAARRVLPEPWTLPGKNGPTSANALDEVTAIADLSDISISVVKEAAKRLFVLRTPMDELVEWCSATEAQYARHG